MSMITNCPKCGSNTDTAGNCLANCYEKKYRVITSLTEDDLRRVLREVIREEIKSLKPTDWSSLTDWKRNAK